MEETIVAVFDTAAHAEAAASDLRAANVPGGAISLHAGASTVSPTTAGAPRSTGFWSNLFGGEPDHDTAVYDRSLQGGSTVLSVKTPEAHIDSVMAILDRHNPVDIDERASGYGLTGTAASATTLRTPVAGSLADDKMQLSEEQLVVGKRVVNRGGTRIRRFVVETPVEEQVSLHDERVVIDRHPVTGAATTGVADFSEKTIEMTESAEEAVVGKTSRVVEEISLRKHSEDRTETVRDTVRREDIKVEQIPGEPVTTTTAPVMPTKPRI